MTFTAGSCKSLSHELAQGRAPRRARLSSRQFERSVAAGGARSDRCKGSGRVHLCRCRAYGRRQPGGALSAFSRPRRSCCPSIAQRAFEPFEATLTQAWDDGRPDTVTAFERVGNAYLAFARDGACILFGDVRIRPTGRPQSDADGRERAGIRHHPRRAERLAALAPPACRGRRRMMMALHIWSMSHGVASLFARGDAARRKLPMSPEDLLEAEVLIYLRGLGFPTDQRPAKDAADQKSSSPPPVPPVPPGGPWGKPK